MNSYLTAITYVSGFALIALASKQIGQFLRKINLPLITGFLITGIIAGPFILNLIPAEAVHSLRFIDELALAVIAFAAGNELYLKEIRDRFKSITWVTAGLVSVTFTFTSLAILFLSNYIPFMQDMSMGIKIAVSILGGAVMVARSPSSAIAIVNELRAKGPFTKTALGVTMISDVVVILLFGLNSSVADALVTGLNFDLGFIGLLLFELILSIGIGYVLFKIIQIILSSNFIRIIKSTLLLLFGYGVFPLSLAIRNFTHNQWSFELIVEPLLICMFAGFMITNYSSQREQFSRIIHDVSPAIYILFFTLTGAFLSLDILIKTWPIAVALFSIRVFTIFIGAFFGGRFAGDPPSQNKIAWMAYITQAGVGLGLAKEIALDFPVWGESFATILISVIVLNQLAGPPFFKWAIKKVGESHIRAKASEFDGQRDAILFGLKAQSISLARQLIEHNWQVKIVCTQEDCEAQPIVTDIETFIIDEITLEHLEQVKPKNADAIVSFFDNEKSYQICELFYENFGTENMVVRLKDRSDFERFHKLGVKVVEPQTAVVSLLEHYVRSPVGTSLLLGMGEQQDMIDLVVRDPQIHDVPLKDIRLPLDVLVVSVQRDGHTLVSRGYLKFKLGDKVTLVGPMDKLEEARLLFRK
ncbi:MAG: potassium transporter TrkA [Chloroflexi bacterium]|nr:potassium transporter TrkA [Chloroflexota bacterium]MBT3670807.1 potassium transporter TrkA [Chloroflexota bacterium]MBT4004094.1 potassium transporter TrkA [Chloroflexota bacterium]MBT4305266.1 potassium transporter TrkA [Chloroflexota bacterium]MBT4532412.1 potassium transporter TrkA [Chloroflexota bacterium]